MRITRSTLAPVGTLPAHQNPSQKNRLNERTQQLIENKRKSELDPLAMKPGEPHPAGVHHAV